MAGQKHCSCGSPLYGNGPSAVVGKRLMKTPSSHPTLGQPSSECQPKERYDNSSQRTGSGCVLARHEVTVCG